MAPERRPTSHDVARAAGVSRATVSYVLNDVTRQRISPEVQQRVLQAVEELQYTPHHHARMLKVKESDIVLILMIGVTPGPVSTQVTDTLTRRIAAAGYTPLVDYTGVPSPTSFTRAASGSSPSPWLHPDPCCRRGSSRRSNSTAPDASLHWGMVRESQLPVSASRKSQSERLRLRSWSSEGAGMCCSSGPTTSRLADISEERLQGVRRVLAERHIRTVTVPRISIRRGNRFWTPCKRNRRSTRVFVYNDEIALIVLQVLREAGIGVPEDVSVIGCDNLQFAALTQPSLTTMDLGDVGGQIADHLLAMLEGNRRPTATVGLPTVIERESA